MYIPLGTSPAVKNCITKILPRGSVTTAGATAVSLNISEHGDSPIELEIEASAACRVFFMPSVNTATIATIALAADVAEVTAGREYLITLPVADVAKFSDGMVIEIFASDTTTLRMIGIVQGVNQKASKVPQYAPTQIRIVTPFGAMGFASLSTNSVIRWGIARNDTSNHYYTGTIMAAAEVKRVIPPSWAKYISLVRVSSDARIIVSETG